jgi:predicted kinase
MNPALPSLIVITGRPGAGKSTLSHRLARAVRCPLISRDEIKEGRLHTAADVDDREITREVFEAFFTTLEQFLRRRVSLVAEAAFQHKVWQPNLAPLLTLARVRVIICQVPGELALQRRCDRLQSDPDRERFHPDLGLAAAPSAYDPPRLDAPTLDVDTSADYRPGFDEIVSFARG